MTLLVRELHFRCDNDECGHAFVATLEISRTTRPSARPDPNVHLPIVAKRPLPAPANDDSVIANDNMRAATG